MAEGGTSQDMERNQLHKGHSPTGDGRGRDKSGHVKKPTVQWALTPWRQPREGQVRTLKGTNHVRDTYNLEIAEGGTSQDIKRNQLSKGHSQSRESRGRDKSGH